MAQPTREEVLNALRPLQSAIDKAIALIADPNKSHTEVAEYPDAIARQANNAVGLVRAYAYGPEKTTGQPIS